jgi:hypothetical protein
MDRQEIEAAKRKVGQLNVQTCADEIAYAALECQWKIAAQLCRIADALETKGGK